MMAALRGGSFPQALTLGSVTRPSSALRRPAIIELIHGSAESRLVELCAERRWRCHQARGQDLLADKQKTPDQDFHFLKIGELEAELLRVKNGAENRSGPLSAEASKMQSKRQPHSGQIRDSQRPNLPTKVKLKVF